MTHPELPDCEEKGQPALAAERSVLGACLLHANAVPNVAAILQPGDFYLPRHSRIFAAILATHSTKGTSDPLVVGEDLRRSGHMVEVGGHEQLLDLLESVVTAAGVEYHAEIVREHALRRRLLSLAQHIQVRVSEGAQVPDLCDDVERYLRELRGGEEAMAGLVMQSWLELAAAPPVAWAIDGIEPKDGSLLLAGEPGSGKSLQALDKALRKAHGMNWMGRRCTPGSTLYLAGEGCAGLAVRVRAWYAANPKARPVDGHYVAIVDGVPDLTKPSAVVELERLIHAAERRYGRKPNNVTIDTLAMATPGADENDAGPVGAVQAALAEIRRRHHCSTTTLHHLRKPSAERPAKGQHAVRGSSAIVGAADVVVIAAVDGDAWALTTVKVRDGELLSPLRYEVRGQDTGRPLDDGRPEFGPVVIPAAVASSSKATDLDAEADADIARVVAKLGELGSASSANSVVRRIKGNRQNLLVAFREAVDRGLVLNIGTTRQKKYVVAGAAGSAGARAASPQTPGGSGTGNQPEAGPDSDQVPKAGGNQSEPVGTSSPDGKTPRSSRGGWK